MIINQLGRQTSIALHQRLTNYLSDLIYLFLLLH